MNKKIFVTGEAKITSLLRDYIMSKTDADFFCVDSAVLDDSCREWVNNADYIILMHEIGRCSAEEEKENMLLTKSVIDCLPLFRAKATIVDFVPRRGGIGDDNARVMKLQTEQFVQKYSCTSGSRAVLYRTPEIFGTCFNNDVIDRLISEGRTDSPDASYEFIHTEDFLYELYRMINGAPAYMGRDNFAYPKGSFFVTEASLLKSIERFSGLKPFEIPDFSSDFERRLYDYFVQNIKQLPSCEMEGDTLLCSKKFGRAYVKRLQPEEECCIDLHCAGGVRMFLLCGSIRISNGKEYCADGSVVRINLTENTFVKNIGGSISVLEIWSHTIS